MRVISGKYRGIRLRSLPDAALRPMLDRVKESLFNILRDSLADAHVLDLFSGSGSLGIEALSRGASTCVFVERSMKLGHLIEQNLALCGIGAEQFRVIRSAVHALPAVPPRDDMTPADLVFLDPPYAMTGDADMRAGLFLLLERLLGGWVSTRAVTVLHHAPEFDGPWPTGVFRCIDGRVYGRSRLSFFQTIGFPET